MEKVNCWFMVDIVVLVPGSQSRPVFISGEFIEQKLGDCAGQ